MSDIVKAPPASYWSDLRRYEAHIYDNCHVESIRELAEEAVEVWSTESPDGIDLFDTMSYDGQTPFLPWRRHYRKVTLTTFDDGAIPAGQWYRKTEARIFELSLAPGDETMTVYAGWLPLAWYGLCAPSAKPQRKALKLYTRSDMLQPSDEDYEIVKRELHRGASGAFRIPLVEAD